MPHITSANVACGFHGGDPHVMRKTVAPAVRHDIDVSPTELKDYLCST